MPASSAQPADCIRVDIEIVALGTRPFGEHGELVQPIENAADGRRAIEWRTMPRFREVAPLDE